MLREILLLLASSPGVVSWTRSTVLGLQDAGIKAFSVVRRQLLPLYCIPPLLNANGAISQELWLLLYMCEIECDKLDDADTLTPRLQADAVWLCSLVDADGPLHLFDAAVKNGVCVVSVNHDR